MEVLKKNLYFALLVLVYIVFLFLYWGKFGDPVIDCGREAYIPYAMGYLDKILFKDIICIYGPVPYYLNAIVLKIFGANFNVVWGIGAFLSFIFLLVYFKLARRFLGALSAFLISLLVLFCCIFSSSISNFIFPYSYAIVYALVFAVFHLYFLIKFVDCKKSLYLYLSAIFLSLCVLSKLDFIPCLVVLPVLMFLCRKNLSFKISLNTVLSFLMPPMALFLVVFFQKVTFNDLIFNFKMISNMAHSPSLQYFYGVCTGYFFNIKKTFMFVPQFLGAAVVFVLSAVLGLFALKIKNHVLKITALCLISVIGAIVIYICFFRYVFLYLPLLIAFFTILNCGIFLIKKLKNSFAVVVTDECINKYTVIIFSLLFSLKSLFGLFHELYGTFYIPFIVLSCCLILSLIFKNCKGLLSSALCMIMAVSVFLFLFGNSLIFYTKNTPVKTPAGTFYTTESMGGYLNQAIDFLDKNLGSDNTFVSLPEGLLLNFALKKDYPYFNTSFTPLDFDAYGEEYLINRFINNQPKYLLILSRHYGDYGKSFMCNDFGNKFCQIIENKYVFKYVITSNPADSVNFVRIFERKN